MCTWYPLVRAKPVPSQRGGKTLGVEPGPFYGSLVRMYGFQYKGKKECTNSSIKVKRTVRIVMTRTK